MNLMIIDAWKLQIDFILSIIAIVDEKDTAHKQI